MSQIEANAIIAIFAMSAGLNIFILLCLPCGVAHFFEAFVDREYSDEADDADGNKIGKVDADFTHDGTPQELI